MLAVAAGAKVLAHREDDGFSFAAFADGSAQRSVVLLRQGEQIAVTYDIAREASMWSLAGGASEYARVIDGAESAFLNVIGPGARTARDVSNIDLAGVRVRGWAILFHTELRSARSAVSFAVDGDSPIRILVTGLAPGAWEVWRNGWLEEPEADVRPEEGSLYREARAGSYFLRRPS